MNAIEWQERLAELGYAIGAVDGIHGPATRRATLQYQRFLRDRGFDPGTLDGRAGPLTFAADAAFRAASLPVISDSVAIDGGAPIFQLSPEARRLVYKFEVGGGRSYYDRFLSMPTWPGYASGVTIGLGYDLGYVSSREFMDDWRGRLSAEVIGKLLPCIGLRGQDARNPARVRRNLLIPWSAAEAVFDAVIVPRHWQRTRKAFPGVERLASTVQGALWSLVFNRGASMGHAGLAGFPQSDSRKEMREVREAIANHELSAAADAIERMCRLWKDNPESDNDLTDRRRGEAALVRFG